MKTNQNMARNFVAKNAHKSNKSLVHENKKRKADLALGKYKKGPLYDLI